MALALKLSYDLLEDSFLLFAVYCNLMDYKLSFVLNQHLQLKLSRRKTDLELEDGVAFPIFEWDDEFNDRWWTLVPNKIGYAEDKSNSEGSLFSNSTTYNTKFILPELKEVNYLLKVETEEATIGDALLKNMTAIPQVLAANQLEINTLKSKRNLIFS